MPGAVTMMVPYQAVFFDAGGTLLEQCPSPPEVIARLLHERGFSVDEVVIADELTRATERMARAANGLAVWRQAMGRVQPSGPTTDSNATWAAIYDAVIAQIGVIDGDDLGTLAADALAQAEHRLFPDVVPVLRRLHSAGLVLGLISNFDVGLGAILDAYELMPYFAVQAVSGADGIAKPDVAVFELAVARAGIPPPACVHVGDELWFDVAPAVRAGMTPVLVDRAGRHPTYHGLRITSLDQLVDVLQL